jgi:hypothetical protein
MLGSALPYNPAASGGVQHQGGNVQFEHWDGFDLILNVRPSGDVSLPPNKNP